jgi:hypothetical protein
MITPNPTDKLKKICPAAASHVFGFFSASQVRVPHVAEARGDRLIGMLRVRVHGQHAHEHDDRRDAHRRHGPLAEGLDALRQPAVEEEEVDRERDDPEQQAGLVDA